MIFLALFGATFFYVFLKAFQQRNVAFNHYLIVAPISMLMAAADVFAITKIAANGWSFGMVATIGAAGALGSMAAMLVHTKLFARNPT